MRRRPRRAHGGAPAPEHRPDAAGCVPHRRGAGKPNEHAPWAQRNETLQRLPTHLQGRVEEPPPQRIRRYS